MPTDIPSLAFPRRAFLAAGATTLLAATFSRAAAPIRRIRAGFLGIAYSHFKDKHQLLKTSPDYDLVGLCEEDPTARRGGPESARWLTREQLFAEAELIVVESGLGRHGPDAMSALRAGKHVHVEKPPATRMSDFEAMAAVARSRKLLIQVGYMWRHNPGMNRAMEAAQRGWLGDVYLVRAMMNTLNDAEKRKEWAEFGGGAMFEQGAHLIDAVVRLMGKPERISPFLKRTGRFGDALADNTVAVFEYPKAMAIITSAPLQPNAGPQRFFEIMGTRGTARVQPLEPPALTLDLGEAAGPYQAGRQEVSLPPYRRYVDEFAELAAAIRESRPLTHGLDLELRVHRALMTACRM
ncbi:MAG: Gfo/Idh/MocA family oxidoreductase [Verrucomicrobia bacterium]|nr:Gfo/Idh/MocA family oxidoreductase [Verrucomicrobiota bacterium]MBI3866977.1 Gfo/Idh/MocA family oxidoreductase [Verrucomicrobiota bacterium]